MATPGLTKRFIQGLKNYDLTLEEIQSSNWRYCGGTNGAHLNYFKLMFKNKKPLLPHEDKCVCGHPIRENCFITDGTRFIVLGTCCIKKFVRYNSRTCEECGEPHRNRIVNLCNDCRKNVCEKCGEECDYPYRYCASCAWM